MTTTNKTFFDDVLAFRAKFDLGSAIADGPTMWDEVRKKLHHVDEERTELVESLFTSNSSRHDAADAIGDLIYVLCGMAAVLEIPLNEVWDRIHEANMSKVRVASAEESKRKDPYDLKKPDGWSPPEFSDLFKKQFPFDT